MTPVDQTTFGIDRYPYVPGNCLSACVATLLDVPTRTVPIFLDVRDSHDGIWLERLTTWLAYRDFEMRDVEVDVRSPEDLSLVAPSFPYILCGTSVRGRDHAVIAAGGEIIHDPHPSRTGLVRANRIIAIL